MPIHVRLSPLLRKYVPEYDHENGLVLEIAEGTKVRRIIETLGIPPEEVVTIMVNSYPGKPGSIVKDGDLVTLTKIIGGG
ncbi:MAG: hypothetical protein JSW39_19490 [Desulfobacterales bacterium]|nr:MAG: hypothetical protein JSW39_19490 [Desulfobacterales bacterium]